MAEPHKSIDHSPWEDATAFLLGTAFCALGIQFLGYNNLITGQTAGLGVVLTYLTSLPFGLWFFLINLPFYILAWLRMGPRFTIKSFIAVAMVSGFSELFAHHLGVQSQPTFLGAPLAGALIGMGLLAVFRHGGSLGGIGVLALYLQDRTGLRAGWTQLGFDAVLFAIAVFLFDATVVLWSVAGAVVTNLIVATNHRQDRYVAR